MSNRFNFNIYGNSTQTAAQRRNFRADILDFNENFEKINEDGAMIADLSHVYTQSIAVNDWVYISETNYYEATIANENIEAEPQIIDVVFTDLTAIQAPILPKPNSQASGSFKLITATKPTQQLTAKIILTRGIV